MAPRTCPASGDRLLAKVIDECFYDAWYKDKETKKKVYTCAYDWEEDLQDAQEKSARLLGMAWRAICRNGDPLPKLQRYETALSNRIMKAVKLLLKLRGHDQHGQLQNEPNFESTPEESVAQAVENPPPAPPEPEPVPVPDARPPPPSPKTAPRPSPRPPARETTLTTAKTEPKTSQPAPGKRL
jgi:hypothetical protein